MAKYVDIKFVKTFATRANAEKAVAKVLGSDHATNWTLRYTVVPVETDTGLRYGVLFFGESAVQAGIHFHFNVVG
ncbi:hypothetical protein [Microcystis phage Me-ZS1]|nr:hypothetical protein [Microcystis phage Me-ZS1]